MIRTSSAVYLAGGLLGLAAVMTFLPVRWVAAQVVPHRVNGTIVLTPNAVPPATGPAGLIDQAATNDAQIYVDDSFPAVDALRTAQRLESQHQSQQAIQKYQDMVDQYGQKLILAQSDTYVSITDYVMKRLLAMPSMQQGQYDQIFGPQAQKLIEALIDQRDPAALLRACDRYYPSSAAMKGLAQVAAWYFERGDFSTAARVWEKLLVHPQAKEIQAEVLHHLALAQFLAGHNAESKKFHDRLADDFPTATGVINGQSVTLLDNLNSLLAQASQSSWSSAKLSGDEWPTFQGSPSHSLVNDVNSSAGAKLWWVNYASDVAPEQNRGGYSGGIIVQGGVVFRNGRAFYPNNNDANMGANLSSFPVLSDGIIYFHTGDSILARSASGGNKIWDYPEHLAKPDPNMPQQLYGGGYATRSTNHDSCTVFGDQVFAILPGGVTRNESNGRMYAPVTTNRLVALGRSRQPEGHQLLWEKPSNEISRELEKDFPKLNQGTLVLTGSPVVTRQGVYVLARKFGGDAFTQLYLIHLDRETGKTLWGCYLCSSSTNNYYNWGIPLGGVAMLSVADDMVYVTTGQGADCAVDANAGRIIWLGITESAKATHTPETYYARAESMHAWCYNPPLISGDKLITAEMGSNIRIYNRDTGRLLRTFSPKEIGDIACGVIGDTLYTLGTKIYATNINTGVSVWPAFDLSMGNGKVVGRPFLTTHALYISFDKGLLTFDINSGAPTNFSEWPKDDNSKPGKPGNLLVTSEQIIVATDTEIAGYSNWETALANHQRDIHEHPADPLQYMELAEIAYRTSHLDLAQEQMQKAIDLVVMPEARPEPELLARLYNTNLNFGEQLLAKTDAALRDRSRFYYMCCKAAAHDLETQAEWRLCLADLAERQLKADEAMALYNDVLVDPALRYAPFRRNETMRRAGITAEVKIRALITQFGRDSIYKIYEDRATAALNQAQATPANAAPLQAVIDSYPNSRAALAAAGEVAALDLQHADYLSQIKTLRWLYQHATLPEIKTGAIAAQATADLALAQAAIKRDSMAINWAERGRRQFKDQTIRWQGRSGTFAELCDQLHQNIPLAIKNRWPMLPNPVGIRNKDGNNLPLDPRTVFSADGNPHPIFNGKLLTPLETAPNLRRADVCFVSAMPGKVSMIDAATLAQTPVDEMPVPKWTFDLNGVPDPDGHAHNGPLPYVLLGCSGNAAVFACNDRAVTINIEKHDDKGNPTVCGVADFNMTEEEQNHYAEQMNRMRELAVQQQQLGIINGNGGIVFNGEENGNFANNPLFNLSAEQKRTLQFNAALGRTRFTSLHLLGTHMFAIVGNKLWAYDIVSGKVAWHNPVTLPDGLPVALVGNDEMVVVQVDSPDKGTPAFVTIDVDTGNLRGSLKLDDEHVVWRELSDDGTLFVISDQAVSAYDMHGDLTTFIWKNKELRQLKYPNASILSLDSLLVINNNNELVCLPQEGGDERWVNAEFSGQLHQTGGQWLALQSAIDGDNVIFTCTQCCASFNTANGEISWNSIFDNSSTPVPPLIEKAFADPYLIMLGQGPMGTIHHAVHLFALDRRPGLGKICWSGPVYRNGMDADRQPANPDGPNIVGWQVIDNAILLHVSGVITATGTLPDAVLAFRPMPQPSKPAN